MHIAPAQIQLFRDLFIRDFGSRMITSVWFESTRFVALTAPYGFISSVFSVSLWFNHPLRPLVIVQPPTVLAIPGTWIPAFQPEWRGGGRMVTPFVPLWFDIAGLRRIRPGQNTPTSQPASGPAYGLAVFIRRSNLRLLWIRL